MKHVFTNDSVRLADEFPDLGLRFGDEGVVRSAWHYPNVAYEVEFRIGRESIRVLLMENQVTADRSQCAEN